MEEEIIEEEKKNYNKGGNFSRYEPPNTQELFSSPLAK